MKENLFKWGYILAQNSRDLFSQQISLVALAITYSTALNLLSKFIANRTSTLIG